METFESEDIVETSGSRFGSSKRIVKVVIVSLAVSCVIVGCVVGINPNGNENQEIEAFKLTKKE